MGIIEHSGKMMILMDILSQSVALHEKILVFRYSVVRYCHLHICQLSHFILFGINKLMYLKLIVNKWCVFCTLLLD